MPLKEGASFGPYRVVDQLGKGGMSFVYRAYEAALDRHVALKVLPAEFLFDETFAARFTREAKVIARLEHPCIVPIYASGIDEGMPWMAMRLIPGGTLSTLLERGQLPVARSIAILRGIANGLAFAHGQGVIHRDLKPQNVLLDQEGQVYLADFGIARIIEGSTVLTRTGTLTGTPQYMAPEQALEEPVDLRADVYALGILAYEMLTGRVPFTADTPMAVMMKHLNTPIPLEPLKEAGEPLAWAVRKALAKAPADRWATVPAFVEALEGGMDEIRAGLPTGPVARPLPDEPVRAAGAEPAVPVPPTASVPSLPAVSPAEAAAARTPAAGTAGPPSLRSLLVVPAVITLAITLLRLAGELLGWSPTFFSRAPGGAGAVIGIVWLVPVFGIYFGWALARGGTAPGTRRVIGHSLGAVALVTASALTATVILGLGLNERFAVIFLAAVVAAGLAYRGWPALGRALLAYGLLARLPVVIVMLVAIFAGWGTHYDVPPPNFPETTPFLKWVYIGLLPQLLLWVPFTMFVGALFAGFTLIAVRRQGPSVAVPALLTLVITLVRLVGELLGASPALFSREPGGAGAIVGIVWLVPIFGIYFGRVLARKGTAPGAGRVIGYSLLACALPAASAFTAIRILALDQEVRFAVIFVASMVAAGVAYLGWPALGRALLAYGLLARVPVAIVMLAAIFANWGTHYDLPPPNFPEMEPFRRWVYIGLLPQMLLWVPFTMFVGALSAGLGLLVGGRKSAAA
jgi:hypothetical protein